MSSHLIIREARIEELDCLLALEQKVIAAERPFNHNLKISDVTYYEIEHLITDRDSCMLVAEVENRIVATGYAQLRESKVSLDHTQHSYLGFMFVEPEARGRGVNKKILAALITWSKSKGANNLYLDVYTDNDAAISAYRKMGFEKSMLEMKLCVD